VNDLEQLEVDLARAFPELRVAPLRRLATGFGSIAVETADEVVFRIPREAGTAHGHEDEYRALPVLAPLLPAPVPVPGWRIERGDRDFPLGAIGYRKLPGRHPGPTDLAAAAELGAFLAALHGIPLELVEELGLQPWLPPRDSLLRFRDAVLPTLAGILSPDEYDRVRAWWDELLEGDLERFEPALRHGDPWYGNVLVDAGGALAGVLDWEGIEIGDPAADLAAQAYLGEEFLASVMAGYEQLRGGFDAGFGRRVRLLAELREFGGVRRSNEVGDERELGESVAKLRAGRILSG
jgi:aminoglycoside phosphotransferase (APT) family kinase protein